MGSGLGGPWGSTRGSARRLRAGRPGAGGRAGSLEERSWRAWRWSGPGHSQGSRAGRRAAVERWRPGLRTGGELRCGTAGAGPAVAARAPRCVRQQRGAVRVAMLRSSPVRRRVPIVLFTSLQGQNRGVSPIRQRGDRSWGRVPRQPGFLTETVAAPPPPCWCRSWRWSRKTGSRGPGGGSGWQWGPGYPGGPKELLLAMASCCPWSVWTSSARPGCSSVLFSTSINGCDCSVSCRMEGWHGALWGWQPTATLAASHHACAEPGSQMWFQA